MIPRIEPSHARRAFQLLTGSKPTAAEREALELRAAGRLHHDEDLAAVTLRLTHAQAAALVKP